VRANRSLKFDQCEGQGDRRALVRCPDRIQTHPRESGGGLDPTGGWVGRVSVLGGDQAGLLGGGHRLAARSLR
jgi:hypothetical protein